MKNPDTNFPPQNPQIFKARVCLPFTAVPFNCHTEESADTRNGAEKDREDKGKAQRVVILFRDHLSGKGQRS